MIDRNKQVPDMFVYAGLYAIIFGISIWILAFQKESTSNWILYVGITFSIVAGLAKFAVHSRKKHQQTA